MASSFYICLVRSSLVEQDVFRLADLGSEIMLPADLGIELLLQAVTGLPDFPQACGGFEPENSAGFFARHSPAREAVDRQTIKSQRLVMQTDLIEIGL